MGYKSIQSIGFPKMDKEVGEKRDFLPDFFSKFVDKEVNVYLEEGYGGKLGYSSEDYLRIHAGIRFVSKEEIFSKDMIVVIRQPEETYLKMMKPNSILLSMLHYDTRPNVFKLLNEYNIQSFSLDSIVDDENQRLVVSYEVTALSGLHAAFSELKKRANHQQGKALKISIIGIGNLGIQAGRLAFKAYNDFSMNEEGYAGISVEFLDKDTTAHRSTVEQIFKSTDILIDATRRPDATQIIIPNHYLAYLPEEAIILDLTADPYEVRGTEIQLKAIEGIPHGNLDKYVFYPIDPIYEQSIPKQVASSVKRTTVSCNAWPGVKAKECMRIYAEKIWPFISILLNNGNISVDSENLIERALARSTRDHFNEAKHSIKGEQHV